MKSFIINNIIYSLSLSISKDQELGFSKFVFRFVKVKFYVFDSKEIVKYKEILIMK